MINIRFQKLTKQFLHSIVVIDDILPCKVCVPPIQVYLQKTMVYTGTTYNLKDA